jgi:hypothetical protein
MAIGSKSQAGHPLYQLGVQPTSPTIGIGKVSYSPSYGAPRASGGLHLPSASSLDYAHKLTSTTALLVGAAAFLVVFRGRPRAALRGLVRKHIAEVK